MKDRIKGTASDVNFPLKPPSEGILSSKQHRRIYKKTSIGLTSPRLKSAETRTIEKPKEGCSGDTGNTRSKRERGQFVAKTIHGERSVLGRGTAPHAHYRLRLRFSRRSELNYQRPRANVRSRRKGNEKKGPRPPSVRGVKEKKREVEGEKCHTVKGLR